MRTITVDLTNATTRSDIHDILAKSFELPEDYGRNLDDLYDQLSTKFIGEMVEVEMKGFETLPENLTKYGNSITKIFERVSSDMVRVPDNSIFQIKKED